jgi:hypothetical protein
MTHGNHLKHMLIIGGVLLVGLLVFGVPTGSALITAAVLACPIGMAAMMFVMMRGPQGHGADQTRTHPPTPTPAPVRTPVGPLE